MRLVLDETVLVEFIGEPHESCACRDRLNALQITGAAELWTTVFAYERLLDRVGRDVPAHAARGALLSMADFVNICSFDEGDMLDVLRSDKSFPLSASVICLEKLKADRLVTRDQDAIALAPGIACTPEGFFDDLERERGIVFELVDL